jgi:hypothetical protein
MGQIHKRAAAKRDLVQHYVYLAEHADLQTAERFSRKRTRVSPTWSGIRP